VLPLETSTVIIVTVPVEQKMLTHESGDLLVLFRTSLFCPKLVFCSMPKVFVTVLIVKN